MNCLHNYIVNDTPSFLSQSDRIETVFEMCKHVCDIFNRLFNLEFLFIRLLLMISVKIPKLMQLN